MRVRAVAVNFPDVLLARGEYQVRPPLPFTPGIELCGDVVALGAGVDRARVGRPRGRARRSGVLAEYAVVPAHAVHPAAPEQLDDAAAAALTIAYQTAWFGLHQRARCSPARRCSCTPPPAASAPPRAARRGGRGAGDRRRRQRGEGGRGPRGRRGRAVDRAHARTSWPGCGRATGAAAPTWCSTRSAATRSTHSTKCDRASRAGSSWSASPAGEIQAVRADHALVKNYSVLGLHWALYQRSAGRPGGRRARRADPARSPRARCAAGRRHRAVRATRPTRGGSGSPAAPRPVGRLAVRRRVSRRWLDGRVAARQRRRARAGRGLRRARCTTPAPPS